MRSNRAKVNLGVLALSITAGLAAALPASAQLSATEPAATRAVLNKYPGAKAQLDKGRVVALYGKPMSAGRTPDEAAENFLRNDKQGFDVQALDLQPLWAVPFKDKPFTAFVYQQYIEGLPVEYGQARVLVWDDMNDSKVVLAGAKLAKLPEGKTTLNATAITGAAAKAVVARMPEYQLLEEWTEPELVVYFGEGDKAEWSEPRKVWKFNGAIAALDRLRRLTFFVDATTGALVHARNNVLTVDVQGTVQAMATPTPPGNCAADHAGNPAVLTAVPNIRINSSSVYSDAFGGFLLPNGGAAALNITAIVSAGQWARVTDGQGTPLLTDTENVLPPGPANLLLNPTPSEFTTAQANAFIHQNRTHNHFRDRAPSFPNLDTVLPANVNLNQVSIYTSCNAVYDGTSTSFLKNAGGCNNAAFSMVVAHEYGHHIVNQLGLAQGAFGEGFGDVMAMMIFDDSVMGRFFRTDGSPVRTPLTASIQYPCSCNPVAAHCCGQMLSAACWRIKTNFQNAYGAVAGLELARQLNVDWALITNGGSGNNSAHPTTAIEYLTVDDIDGDLANGTPNYTLICNAFSQGGIACPAVALLDFVYPSGTPSTLTPNQPSAFPVNIVSLGGSPVAGSGQIHVSVNGGAFVASPMAQGSPNQYMAALPAQGCGSSVRYYISASAQGGGTVTDPPSAPAAFYSAAVATGTSVVLNDNFETNLGWNTPAPADTATTAGRWTRVDPNATVAQPEDDHTGAPGTMCYVTGQGTVGGASGNNDVDTGITYLVSPQMNFTGTDVVDARVAYWRWYSNDAGGGPNNDTFLVQVSNNNGTNWTTVETIGPSGAGTSGGWIYHEFRMSDFPAVARTAQMRVRFVAQDTGTASLVEAGVDDFLAENILCEETPPPTPPEAFALQSPAHGATEVELAPTFQWQASAGADTYTIKIDDDSSLASPIYQQSGLTGTSTSLPPNTLDDSTTYWWGVVATNVGGSTNSTPTAFSFTTIVPPPTCEADANGDSSVDAADLSVLLSNFGGSASGPGTGDFNNDGQCNSADLSVLLSQFGQTC